MDGTPTDDRNPSAWAVYKNPPGFLGFLLCRLNTTQQDFVAGLENPGQSGCFGSTQHTIAIRATQAFCTLATHIPTLATHVPGTLSQSAENLNTPRPEISLFRSLLAPCGSGRPKNLQKIQWMQKNPSAILWLGFPNPARFCCWVFQPSRGGQSRKENPGPFADQGFQPTGGLFFFKHRPSTRGRSGAAKHAPRGGRGEGCRSHREAGCEYLVAGG